VLIPMTLICFDGVPAIGLSGLLTTLTGNGGFFIFLRLATLFLVRPDALPPVAQRPAETPTLLSPWP